MDCAARSMDTSFVRTIRGLYISVLRNPWIVHLTRAVADLGGLGGTGTP